MNNANEGLKRNKKFNYSWLIIAMSTIMVCITLGFCSSTKSLYIKAITDAYGISRSVFSLNDSFRYIGTSVVNLFFGYLILKYDAKKLIGAGFMCLIASSVIYSVADNIIMFCIGGMLLGVGLSWTTTTMVGYVVNKWCLSNRGTIMGAVLASNGIGGALATQVVSPIINASRFGFKKAYLVVSIILFVFFVIMMIFFKDKPKDENEETSSPKKKENKQSWEGLEYSDAIKKPYFYLSLICVFFAGMLLQGITGIATPHMYDSGINAEYVAIVVSCHSLALTAFKFLTGVFYDKLGLRFTSNLCMTMAIVAFVFLANVSDSVTGRVFAMTYGILATIALPLETIMLPIYANDLFGEKSFIKILGLFASFNTAGYALGAPVTNLCYDITGSYNISLYISCVIMLCVMIAMNIAITSANRARNAVIKASK